VNKRIDIIPIEFRAPTESQIDSVFVEPALLQQSKYSMLLPGTIQGSV
jgi:hypothetical protein